MITINDWDYDPSLLSLRSGVLDQAKQKALYSVFRLLQLGADLDNSMNTAFKKMAAARAYDPALILLLMGYHRQTHVNPGCEICRGYISGVLATHYNKPIAGEIGLQTDILNDKSTLDFFRTQWATIARSHGHDTHILRFAATFFSQSDRELSTDYYLAISDLEKTNPKAFRQVASSYEAICLDPIHVTNKLVHYNSAYHYYEMAMALDNDGLMFEWTLCKLAHVAYEAGHFERARTHSEYLISQSESMKLPGDAIHHGHTTLGRINLSEGKTHAAVSHLHLSAQIIGSPGLNSFGPRMTLARELVERGEYLPVYQYLVMCESFWRSASGVDRLRRWKAAVASNHIPDFEYLG